MTERPIKQRDMERMAAYQLHLRKEPLLQYLFLELTDQCNLACEHCGSSCDSSNSNYLSETAIRKVLLSVKKKRAPHSVLVCITGGEPMLHPDVCRIISMARQLGFPVGMTTNGTLIDESAAKKLRDAGLITVSVSLDGIGLTHDKLRNCKGSFEDAMRGIMALRKAGFDPEAVTVIHRGNIGMLNEMYEYLKHHGFHAWRLVNVDPIGRANEQKQFLLDGEGLKQLYDFIRKKRFDPENAMEVSTSCSHFLGLEYEREVRDFYFQCGAGTRVASIMANGDIGACLDIERRPELIQGNVYRDDFMTVWETKYHWFRQERTEKSSQCSACKQREICMGDSAHTWDFIKNEPKYCVYGKLKENEDGDQIQRYG